MFGKLGSRVRQFKQNLNLRRTLSLIWAVSSKWTALSAFLIVAESASFLLALRFLKKLIDYLTSPEQSRLALIEEIGYAFFLTVLLTLLYTVIKSVSAYITELQATRVAEYIDDRIHQKAVELDLAFYESPSYFNTLKRAKDAGPEKPNLVVSNLVDLIKSGILLAAVGSVIFFINWALLPLLVLFILPIFLVRIRLADKLYHLWQKQTHAERKSLYLSSLMTGPAYAKEIKSFGLGQYISSHYQALRLSLVEEKLQIKLKSTGAEIATTGLATLGFFACVGYIGYATLKGQNTIGDITVFMVLFPQTFSLLQQVSSGIAKVYSNSIYVNGIFELLDLKPTLNEAAKSVEIPDNEKLDFQLHNISFTYPHNQSPVLQDVSLRIPSGKIVAIIGFNGAGKTTLIKLLCRLYDPTAGKITLGGTDIREFETENYREQISVVFQDFARYEFSVADNIRFGNIKSAAGITEIAEAARKSGAAEFVAQFPGGYQTIMGRMFEEGHEVSIGQWQKLAIARSYFRASRLIIFDEASSALDARAEKDLFDTFRDSIGNRAALIISHRLSTVRHADYIYVLSGGTISQEGTHEELIQAPGDYASLFSAPATTIESELV